MPESFDGKMVVAISSRALFDLEESNRVFESEGIEAYYRYQRSREDQVLAPGIAFTLVKKLLENGIGRMVEANISRRVGMLEALSFVRDGDQTQTWLEVIDRECAALAADPSHAQWRRTLGALAEDLGPLYREGRIGRPGGRPGPDSQRRRPVPGAGHTQDQGRCVWPPRQRFNAVKYNLLCAIAGRQRHTCLHDATGCIGAPVTLQFHLGR